MKLTILFSVLLLAGCINIYGPDKTEGQENKAPDVGIPGMSDAVPSVTVTNRSPQELAVAVAGYYRQKGLTLTVQDTASGIVAATGSAPAQALQWLDCGAMQTPPNLRTNYRLVTQIWPAGEGSHVMTQVTGITGKVAADGNDKVKPQECKSSGVFEQGISEMIRK